MDSYVRLVEVPFSRAFSKASFFIRSSKIKPVFLNLQVYRSIQKLHVENQINNCLYKWKLI
ncbi:hypothetical protein B1222_03680 [Paenibacillus larvae subsp. pulvifaciens]|nr:hypothetical protein BXP28_02805 [Paenibacillus larvae subsp. larvae]AQT83713.1 hypothetical protein B1222_03680 [Paenibacillus larvae subsp. pulvifaciens]AQZ48861.1 hypothetical protein B5S25_22025 [Paenibacillus larvae subsp. pulvifaciens]MBH0342297.1 hypothetical protein [Paenibacillus larvae]